MTLTENCPHCHCPFKPVLYKRKDGYLESFYGMKDDKGVYFGFHEERPDGNYSNVAIDFKYCPMCGRKL